MNPDTSEPRKFSPSPRPTTSGELRRAATTTSGWSAWTASSVKAPSRRWQASSMAFVRPPSETSPAQRVPENIRQQRGSDLGVGLGQKLTPLSISSSLSSAKFSIMPLWIRASLPPSARCGCALRSVGPPWVAHRVCPIPVAVAGNGCSSSSWQSGCSASRTSSATQSHHRKPPPPPPSHNRGTPADEAPQGPHPTHCDALTAPSPARPTYPTIPHIGLRLSAGAGTS